MSDKKFELVKQEDTTLYRIRALRAGPWGPVGTIGGYVEKESNLSQEGDCWIHGGAKVFDNACISGGAHVSEEAHIGDDSHVRGSALIYGKARIYGNSNVSGYSCVYDNSRIYGNSNVSGYSCVYGNARLSGNAHVGGNSRVYGNARLSGEARVYGNSRVHGNSCVLADLKCHSYYINGSVHIVNYVGHRDEKPMIKIGCEEHSLENWLENYKEIGAKYKYSEAQIIEYGCYLRMLKELLN